MDEKKWKRFLQKEMDKEMEEIEGILEEMNSDPNLKDVVAPEEMHEKLFAQIREKEAEKDRLTDEEKELIRLGKFYKKKRKWNKYLVLVAAVVCVLAIGVTSLGGPTSVIQKFERIIGDREQEYINNNDERTNEIDAVDEAEAYQQIEDAFGFNLVQLYYLPEGIEFDSVVLTENTNSAYVNYVGENQETVVYFVYLNYRMGSIGRDAEDTLLEEYDKEVDGTTISVKRYLIEENQTIRYIVEFEYQDVYYVLRLNNIEDVEVEKIVENLYFR